MAGRIEIDPRLHSNIDEAGVAKQLRHAPGDERVDALSDVNGNKDVMEARPNWMRRVKYLHGRVRLQARHPSTGPCEPNHFSDCYFGVGNVDQQRAPVHHIEAGRLQSGAPGVPLDHRHVAKPMLLNERARHREVGRVDVESYHAAVGSDAVTEKVEDSQRAAAKVDRALAGSNSDAFQQGGAYAAKLGRLSLQTLAFGQVCPERVCGIG